MATKPVSTYQSPLDWFLGQKEDDYETQLDVIARQFAVQSFNATAFRRELIAKLMRLRYLSPHADVLAPKTFHQILKEARVLGVLLHRDTLLELWKCLLVKEIVANDRYLKTMGLAVSRHPLKFHQKMATELYKCLLAIQALAATYDAHELTQDLDKKIGQEFRKHIHLALHMKRKYQGSRAELLGGLPSKKLPTDLRDEELASRMAVYRTLQPKLKNTRREARGISGNFLCQLSELIGAPPGVRLLSNGESLARALTRSESALNRHKS
jgi:hypothetical protein